MNKDKNNLLFLDILRLMCLFYTPIMVIINLLSSISTRGLLLHWWANLILMGISLILAIIPFAKKKDLHLFEINFFKILINSCVIFTSVSFFVNIIVMMIENGVFWSIFSILLILAYSITIAVLLHVIKFKSYLLTTLFYYFVNGVYFSLLTINIAGLGRGNTIIVLISVFTLTYALISIIYYLLKRSIQKLDDEQKVYKNQF